MTFVQPQWAPPPSLAPTGADDDWGTLPSPPPPAAAPVVVGRPILAAAPTAPTTDIAQGISGALNSAGKIASKAVNAGFFWGSFAIATGGPGLLGRRAQVTPDFLHWNFITDHLVLGALPVVTEVAGAGNHLAKLRAQLEARTPQRRMGLVISALTQEELDGFGLGMVEFAQAAHWRAELGVERCHVVPMQDMAVGVSHDSVIEAVRLIRDAQARDEITYVHCKAGKGRSWTVVMCYLTGPCGMTYAAAAELVKSQRPQVSPSESQIRFVQDFKGPWEVRNALEGEAAAALGGSSRPPAFLRSSEVHDGMVEVEPTATTEVPTAAAAAAAQSGSVGDDTSAAGSSACS